VTVLFSESFIKIYVTYRRLLDTKMAEPDNIQQVVDIDDDEELFVDLHTSYNL